MSTKSNRRNTLWLPPSAVAPNRETVDIFELLGIQPELMGSERGTVTQGDVLSQTIDGRPLNDIWNEFIAALNVFNARRQALVEFLTFSVNNPIEDVAQTAGDDFEEASEFGIPKTIRGGNFFSMGYDFKWYDLRINYTWQFLAEATAAQVESLNAMALEADNRLVFRKVMAAIFNNTNRSANIRGQNYNVYPFYNGDGTVPPAYKNYTFTGSESHYMISGAATVDANDPLDMARKLERKGYGRANGSNMILMVNEQELTTMRTWRVATGAPFDFVPSAGQPPFLLPTNTGGPANMNAPGNIAGFDVVGQYGPWYIIQEDYIPAGYMFGFATGGERNATNPVGIREHQNAALRGLRLLPGNQTNFPLIDAFYQHGLGTGVRHRGAGVVMQVKASGSYDIPAAYSVF